MSINIPESVSSISEYLFWKCTSLTSLIIPESITSIDEHAFYECHDLKTITIPSSVTTIGEAAFLECDNLMQIIVKSETPPSLGQFAFTATNDCPIYVPVGSVEAYKSAGYWSESANRIQAIPE